MNLSSFKLFLSSLLLWCLCEIGVNSHDLKIVNPLWFVELPKYLQIFDRANYIPRFVSLSKYDMVVMDDFTIYPMEQFRYEAVLEKKPQKYRL